MRPTRPDPVARSERFAPAFIAQVRNDRGCDQPAIVVVSGYTRPEDERRARAAGADDSVLKPSLPADSLAHIVRSLGMRR